MRFLFILWLTIYCLSYPAHAGIQSDELLQRAVRQAYMYKDSDKAVRTLRPLSQAGNSEAMLLLSGIYRYTNHDLSLMHLQAAAAKRHPQALYTLGRAYLHGDTDYKIDRDVDKALPLLEEASTRDSADASFELAELYREGKSVAPDPKRAFEYATLEFNQKGSYSASRLARYYRDGIGVPVNPTRAYGLFFVSCYRHLFCDELEEMEPRLTKEQQQLAVASIAEMVRGQSDNWTVRPLELQTGWTEFDRTALLREYKQKSPLYALGQIKSMEDYAALNRPGLAGTLLLEITSVPTGQHKPPEFRRDAVLQRVTQRLARIDEQKFNDLTNVIASTGSLDSWVDKEMSDQQLRYLVALYRSNAAPRIRAAIQTTHRYYADGAKNMWAKAFSAGVSLHGGSLSQFIAKLLETNERQATDPQRQIGVECSANFYLLNARFSKVSSGAFNASLASLPMSMAENRDMLVKFCVEGEYQFVDRVLNWKPVRQELEMTAKWRLGWESSQENRKLEENYLAAVKQLIQEERMRLKL
jgi:hypothetical protein